MRAIVHDQEGLRLAQVPAPRPAEGQVLLRPTLAGVCNTDLEIVRGYLGFAGVLGHEVVAVVEEGPPAWRGRRVVPEINFACGTCATCARGLGRHCPERTVLGIVGQDGAFAEQLVAPLANLHAVPDGLADEEAVFVEPLAAAYEILEQVRIPPKTEALVLGDGKLGMLVAQVLAAAGASVLTVGKHAEHLAILREQGVAGVLLDDWDRGGRDLVVDATGSAAGFALALAATNPRGTLVLKSTVAERPALDLAPLVIHEITVVGSRCGPFAPAIEALLNGRVHVRPLIEARRGLDEGVAALEMAARPGALKVLIDPG